MATNPKVERSLIAFFKKAMEVKKVKIKSSSRGGPHLRIEYRSDLDGLFKSIHPSMVEVDDKVISGSYKTHKVTLAAPIDGIAKKGDYFFLVNAISDRGSLTAKSLTPEELSVAGKKFKRKALINHTKMQLEKLPLDAHIRAFCLDILNEVDIKKYRKSEYEGMLTNTDKNIVGKNFGEILSAIWFLDQNPSMDTIDFPAASNEPLIDYLIVNSNTKETLKVSAKYEKGAPPSINAVVPILKSTKWGPKQKPAADAIIAIAENSTIDGIMKTANLLKAEGNVILKKMMGDKTSNFVTPDSIEKFLSKYATAEEILAHFEPMYKAMGRSASLQMVSRIVKNKQKRNGIVISPFGYNVVDILNKDKDYTELLNSVLNQFTVTQVYLSFKTNGMEFVEKKFSESKFEFHYNANAGQPSLKKISFKMKT